MKGNGEIVIRTVERVEKIIGETKMFREKIVTTEFAVPHQGRHLHAIISDRELIRVVSKYT